MADKSLRSLVGGDLGLKIASRVSGSIPSGVTGNILTASVPNNSSLLRLRVLYASGEQTGITLSADGANLYSAETFNQTTATDPTHCFVHFRPPAPNATGPELTGKSMPEVLCKTFTLSKNAGNTTRVFTYYYEILEPIT